MGKRISYSFAKLFVCLYIFSIFFYNYTPTRVNLNEVFAPIDSEPGSEGELVETLSFGAHKHDIEINSRIYELLFKKETKDIKLIPGGDVFGIKIIEPNVTVSSSTPQNPLKIGDKILSINGNEIKSSEDISKALKASGSGACRLEIIRGGEKINLYITPRKEGDTYKLGVTLRNIACGIGTLTFIEPNTGYYGGLGHGVSDSAGNLIEILKADATGVILSGVVRGEAGSPGELSGILDKNVIGCIVSNTKCGIFGTMSTDKYYTRQPMPIGTKDTVKAGEAEIISTVKNGTRATYKIEITDIDYKNGETKSFKIKVTDPALLTITGGIVRGMSGSPIIQDGKIIGAVTHVLVNDPTSGYGIFIENMLKQAR